MLIGKNTGNNMIPHLLYQEELRQHYAKEDALVELELEHKLRKLMESKQLLYKKVLEEIRDKLLIPDVLPSDLVDIINSVLKVKEIELQPTAQKSRLGFSGLEEI